MAQITSVPRPESTPCQCGRMFHQGTRYGPGRAQEPILVCLDPTTGEGCGRESPALYGRAVIARRSCTWCGRTFLSTAPDHRACSERCAELRAGYRRRRVS